MHAAVVTSFDRPPGYGEVEDPTGPHVVDVVAAGLHPRVRSAADGSHYESTGELPMVPGIDGVGRTADGRLVYFAVPDDAVGSMAERAAVDPRRVAVLPDGVDPVAIAAAMNPAMSSWLALRRRIDFQPGQRVLVLGATGNAGRLAVQIARRLGAAEVIAAGRDRDRLTTVAADRAITLDDVAAAGRGDHGAVANLEDLRAAAEVDVVLDYLWGEAAAAVLPAVLRAREDRGRPLTWVEIGSMAGLELLLPSQYLRAARLSIVGSGQGSIPTADIVAELPGLAAHLGAEDYDIDAVAVPLADVESTWTASLGSPGRIVFTP